MTGFLIWLGLVMSCWLVLGAAHMVARAAPPTRPAEPARPAAEPLRPATSGSKSGRLKEPQAGKAAPLASGVHRVRDPVSPV